MKKPIILLLLSALLVFNSFSHFNKVQQINTLQEPRTLSNTQSTVPGKRSTQKFNNKILGDTLHYESFTDSLPSGYTIVNIGQNSQVIWKWDTLNRISGFLTTIPRIKSTTGATGYMSLPMPFFLTADTYFESDKITITPKASVLLQYQVYIQTCCSSSDIAIEVSTDSINWDSYDISFPANTPNADTSTAVTFESINLSATLANQTDFWYRVYVSGPSSYFVMLDDFAFVEGPCNDLVLSNTNLEFNNTNYNYKPTYSQIPYDFFPALPFSGTIAAEGSCDQTGVGFDIEVNHINTTGGSPATGQGNVYTSLNNIGNLTVLTDTNVISSSPKFTPNVLGDFEVEFIASSDSSDQVPSNNFDTWNFSVGDTVFAKDDNDFDGGVGPANYLDDSTSQSGGTVVGDRFGTLYILENRCGHSPDNIPTSVTFYVSNNPNNIGVEILPKIWEYDEDSLLTGGISAAFGNEVASSFLSYTVSSSDTNSFITLPLTSGTAMTGNGLDSGQYIVGWEVTNLPTGTTFEVANDASSALKQPSFSSFVYFGHAPSAGWQSVDANPVIRLNMGNLPSCLTSIFKFNASVPTHFSISPNPSNGIFKLNITTESAAIYNLTIRNMLGQTVYSTQVQVNGSRTERMDLSGLEKGVYFVTLENDSEKLLKKVVLK